MPSDQSRITYDETYRSVVIQQGRVLTDADLNEAQVILAEETRHEALDLVGPSGTPDNGYNIIVPPVVSNCDFRIGGGTMYVGGVRVSLPGEIQYAQQPDWNAPPNVVPTSFPANELVWLELIETDVSAVEDPALADPALGGPDTAGRTRIIQRIHRKGISGPGCGDGLSALTAAWAAEGRIYDETTKRVLPDSLLKVGFTTTVPTTNPCEPTPQGGYLGAENQLIRVRIISNSELVWSYDNASSIYRVDRVVGGKQLVLASAPVDAAHRPGTQQRVELLRGLTTLASGGVVAEPVGIIQELAADGFNVERGDITLLGTLPADYEPTTARPLYVRVWQEQLTFKSGDPVELTGTGLLITPTGNFAGLLGEGDFWTFAVRPGTPDSVYPKGFLVAQSPNGPRRWAINLGVIKWDSPTQGTVVSDCRLKFENLVDLSNRQAPKSCCSVIVAPTDVAGSFQAILDQARNVIGFKICLLPGEYVLNEPILLTKDHSGIEFEACREGVTIRGGASPAFADGVVQIDGAVGVTFRGIQFAVLVLPARGATVPSLGGGGIPFVDQNANLNVNANLSSTQTARVGVQGARAVGLQPAAGPIFTTASGVGSAIGIRAIDARSLTVEDCQFVFPTAFDVRLLKFADAIGAALLVYGQMNELSLRRNSFIGTTKPAQSGGRATIVGVAMVPALFAPVEGGLLPPFFDPTVNFDFDTTILPLLSHGGFLTDAVLSGTALPFETNPGLRQAGAAVTAEAAGPEPRPPAPAGPEARPDLGGRPGEAFPIFETFPIFNPGVEVFPLFPSSPGKMLQPALLAADISNNRFVGCAAAVFLVGDVGFLRIIGNDVTEAESGFVIVGTRWLAEIAFMGAGDVNQIFLHLVNTALAPFEQGGKWNAVQSVVETAAAMTHPRMVWTATALMSLSLPDSAAARSDLVPLTGSINHATAFAPLVARAGNLFAGAKSALDLPQATGQANVAMAVRNRILNLWGVSSVPLPLLPNQNLATIGFGGLLTRQPQAVLALECTENVVDARANGSAYGGTALLVVASASTGDDSAIVSNNRFSNASLVLPTAALALVSRCTVSGNLVQNQQPFAWPPLPSSDPIREFWSLILIPGPRPHDNLPPVIIFEPLDDTNQTIANATRQTFPIVLSSDQVDPVIRTQGPIIQGPIIQGPIIQDPIIQGPFVRGPLGQTVDPAWIPPLVAITGNVFKGHPVLPPRVLPGIADPLNTWLFLNTVSW